jgi:hypothetical protein
MLKDPNKPAFEQDMIQEINDLLSSQIVELCPRSSVPSDNKALPSIWSFRQKGHLIGLSLNIRLAFVLMVANKLKGSIFGQHMPQ